MSQYTGRSDFRDFLKDRCDDSFDSFMDKTGGVILRSTGISKKAVVIRSAEELIQYYPYRVLAIGDDCCPVIDEMSYYKQDLIIKEALHEPRMAAIKQLENLKMLLIEASSRKINPSLGGLYDDAKL